MICSFDAKNAGQKELFYKINNLINLENETYEKELSGVYAIYKNDICLYVGQSKNLASRISTHISGKYKECDFIYLFDVRKLGYDDFFSLEEDERKLILDNCEKYLISILQPIENIIADFSFKLNDDEKPYFYEEEIIYSHFMVDCRRLKYDFITILNEPDCAIIDSSLLYRFGEKYADWVKEDFIAFDKIVLPFQGIKTK